MKKLLIQMSNWKFILPLFILFLIVFVFIFPNYQGRMAEIAGQEVTPLDSRFSYNYDEVKKDFDKLGPEGRNTYRFVISKIDMLFPVIYGLLFILILAWLLKKITPEGSNWVLLSLFPCIGIIFEYLENFNTLSLLDNYPDITAENVTWGEQMTRLKHIFLFLSVAFMPLLALTLLIKTLRRKKYAITNDQQF
jgi:hypothetical protein